MEGSDIAEEVRHARESLAWSPGRETFHADPEAPPEVLLEPLFWGLFSLGGFITAFLFPVTLFLLFFAAPFGLWPTDPAAYGTFVARYQEPLVRLFFFVLIGGSLFHGTHRLKFMLVDAGLKGPSAEAFLDIVLNGIAIFGSLGALYYALRGWLF
ncbi:MAG: fumarate reductase subunit D [Thermoplasmata archaeon]